MGRGQTTNFAEKASETKKAETISRVLFTSVSTFYLTGKSAYKPSVPSGPEPILVSVT